MRRRSAPFNSVTASLFIALSILGLRHTTLAAAADPAIKCESSKLTTAGKYDSCRLIADAKAVSAGLLADYSACSSKYASKWVSIESAGGGSCPTSGDQARVDAVVAAHQAEILTALMPSGSPTTDAGRKCAGAKLKATGKYDLCRLKADAKAVKTGLAVDYSKCGPKLISSLEKSEVKGGADCPSSGNTDTVLTIASTHTDTVATLLSGVAATSCPTAFRLTTMPGYGASKSNVTRVESGTLGLADIQDLPAGTSMTLDVDSCTGAAPTCGDCAMAGLGASHLGRCSNSPLTSCDQINSADVNDCGGAVCNYYLWGAPRHVMWDLLFLCVMERLTSDVDGSINAETGAMDLDFTSQRDFYSGGDLNHPCPVCSGDSTPNDGFRNGTCIGGARDNGACDANGGDASFGATSLDCPPESLAVLPGVGGPPRSTHLSTDGDSLSFGLPCTPPAPGSCPCAVCSLDPTRPCASDADCVGFGSCSSTGSGVGTRANDCSDYNCAPIGGGLGECNAGPTSLYCDGLLRANGDPIYPCSTNGDCDLVSAGTCSASRKRPCFLDPIVAAGSASFTAPVVGAVECIAPGVGGGFVNAALNLPGPERTRAQFALDRIY